MKGIGCLGIILIMILIMACPKILLIPFIIIGLIFAIIWLFKYIFKDSPIIFIFIILIIILIIVKN